MAVKYISIGSLENIHAYDDSDFSYAVDTDGSFNTDGQIRVGTAPTIDDHVLRLGDLIIKGQDGSVLDGDKLDIDWDPSNYTPDASIGEANDVDDLSAHLKGIDDELGGLGGSISADDLTDYEEGTHTATIACQTSGTVTLKSNSDTLAYTKVGRLVTVTGRLEVDSVSSPVGYFEISLPFSIGSLSEYSEYFAFTVTMWGVSAANVADFVALGISGSAMKVYLGDATAWVNDAAEELQADTRIVVSATYFTS